MTQTVSSISRLGTESAFEVLARAEALTKNGHDIINLGIGQPDFKTADHIVEAAVKALRDGHHGYTPANGLLSLREAVSESIDTFYKVNVNPDQILIVPGGKVTMFFAIIMFGEPGAEIIYPNPGFPIYESLINFSGAKPVPMPLYESSSYGLDAEKVLSLITPRTRLLIINTPSNPTGGIVSKKEMDKLAEGLTLYPKVSILSDEIYSRLLYDQNQHISILNYESLKNRAIVLDGFSKTYAMTGWRIGYGIWPESLIAAATRLAINYHSCVSTASQFAGISALLGPQDNVLQMVSEFKDRRDILIPRLNKLPGFRCPKPGGAFYVFPNISNTKFSSAELQKKCLEDAGVALISGTSFGHHGEGYLRLSYANTTERIQEAISRIKDLF